MTRLIHAELLKQRTTRTFPLTAAVMLALVAAVALLHGLSLTQDSLATRAGQMHVFGWAGLGALFAGFTGALAITAELRYGTIRPTLLVTPRRGRVVVAKAVAGALLGMVLGLVAAATTLGLGSAALAARGITVHISGADALQIAAGTTVAAAAWGLIGVGVGAVVRNQVVTLTGLFAWLLLIEGIVFGLLPHPGRFLPGIAGNALAGVTTTGSIDTLLSPPVAGVLVAAYAAVLLALGTLRTRHDDIR